MGVKLKPIVLGVLFSLALSGCVSTDTMPVNENQAVADYMKLARGYIEQGYTEKAVRPLKRALEIEPGSISALGMLGMAYQLQGEYGLAEEAFRKALSREPKASDVRNNYGAFLFSQNRLQEAYHQFEIASEDVSYSQRSRTFENMGVVSLRQGNRQRAEEHFIRALRLNRNLPRANLELASLYFDAGDQRKAWQYYQAFTGLSKQNARSLLLGVEITRANGDRSKSASYALQLERLYPQSQELKQYRSRTGYDY